MPSALVSETGRALSPLTAKPLTDAGGVGVGDLEVAGHVRDADLEVAGGVGRAEVAHAVAAVAGHRRAGDRLRRSRWWPSTSTLLSAFQM